MSVQVDVLSFQQTNNINAIILQKPTQITKINAVKNSKPKIKEIYCQNDK